MSSPDLEDTLADADAAAFALALSSARMVAWEWTAGPGDAVRLAGDPEAVFGPAGEDGLAGFQALMDRIHPEDRAAVEARMDAAIAERGGYRIGFRTLFPDGSIHWAVSEAQVVEGPEGEGVRLVGTTRCADADHAAATATAEARSADDARARLDAFFRTAPVGMGLLDAELRFLRVNPTLAGAHGASADDHVGRRPAEVLTEAVAALVERSARQALETGLPVEDVALPGGTPEAPQAWSAGFFPALTPSGERVGVGVLARDVTAVVRAEAERAASARRTTLLAEASRLLETSLDYDTTLERLADLVVRHFGAWCTIDLFEGERLVPAVTRHREAAKRELGQRLAARRREQRDEDVIVRVARTGRAELLREVPDAVLVEAAEDAEELVLLRELGLRSAVVVPLTARGRRLGALTVVAEGDGAYDEADLALAVELGRRAALAVDNARLYRTATAEQERSERALATLDGYLERAPVGFALFDRELRVVRVNAALAAISGLPAEEHVGDRAGVLLGEAGQRIDEALRRVLASGEPVGDLEVAGVLPGSPGRERHFLVSCYGVGLPDGDGRGVGVTVVEITDRLHVERALTGQRDLYETLLRAQSEMGEAFVLLEGGRALYVNEAAERMTMRTARELYDLDSVLVLVPEEHHAELGRRIADVLAHHGAARGFETEITTPTGARLGVEVSAQPLETDGRQRLVVVARDVSERRRQDVERERLLRAERRARREIEVAHERARMLAELSEVLDRSMDLRRTLPEANDVLLRHGANVAGIDVLAREGGTLERMAVGADTPERDAQQRELVGTEYALASTNPWATVARTRAPLVGDLSMDVIRGMAGSAEELELLLGTAPRSVAFLPLVARGRTVGVVGLGWDAAGSAPTGPDREHLEEVARRLATGIDNAQLYAERAQIASTLQAGLLPPRLPRIPGVEAAARYLPAGEASEVGGDFYDLYAIDEGRWAVVVGDVCGKGAEAAAVTAMARYTLRAAAIAGAGTPSSALELLNAAMVTERLAERFLTAVLGELRLRPDGRADLTVACAGHPAPIVVRADGRVEAVEAGGPLLGVVDGILWDAIGVALGPGDAVVLYTDGVTEADRRRPMAPAELAAALAAAHPGGLAPSAGALADAVRSLAEERAGGLLRDDVAIVALRLAG